MIVKVQKPLFTNGVPEVLIYNKSRTVLHMSRYTKEWEKWFGNRLKRYANAHIEDQIVIIDDIVADRNW